MLFKESRISWNTNIKLETFQSWNVCSTWYQVYWNCLRGKDPWYQGWSLTFYSQEGWLIPRNSVRWSHGTIRLHGAEVIGGGQEPANLLHMGHQQENQGFFLLGSVFGGTGIIHSKTELPLRRVLAIFKFLDQLLQCSDSLCNHWCLAVNISCFLQSGWCVAIAFRP